MSVSIGELLPAEFPSVCTLFQQVFGVSTSPPQWQWKYAQGPRMGSVNVVARDSQGALVGHAGATVFEGIAAGVPLPMAQVCDVMVAKSARGGVDDGTVYHRLIVALQAALQQRFTNPYAYGFAGVRPFKLGHRLGFYRELHLCRPGYLAHAEPQRTARLWSVRPLPWDSARLDRIWRTRTTSLRVPKVARTGAYLQWRYADHPAHSYQLWVLQRLWEDAGWFVTRTMPNAEVCIVDALLPETAHATILTHSLQKAMVQSGAPAAPLFAWYLHTPQSAHIEPVVGSEVKVTHWHTDLPSPIFQPGDTDVY